MLAVARKPAPGTRLNWREGLTRGLVGCWLFNEGGGDYIYDLSPNQQHALIQNHAGMYLWGAGVQGIGLSGDGGEFNKTTIAHSAPLTFANGDRISASIWHRRDLTGFSSALCSKDSATPGKNNWSLYLNNSNQLAFRYHDASGALQQWLTGSNLTDTPLRHVAFDYVYGTAASAVAYGDGVDAGSGGWDNGSGTVAPEGGTGSSYLGYEVNIGGGCHGFLFQIAIWKNRAGGLTQADAMRLAHDPYVLVQPPLRRHVYGPSAAGYLLVKN